MQEDDGNLTCSLLTNFSLLINFDASEQAPQSMDKATSSSAWKIPCPIQHARKTKAFFTRTSFTPVHKIENSFEIDNKKVQKLFTDIKKIPSKIFDNSKKEDSEKIYEKKFLNDSKEESENSFEVKDWELQDFGKFTPKKKEPRRRIPFFLNSC